MIDVLGTDPALTRFAKSTNTAQWCDAAEELTQDEGYFYKLGAQHWALFCDSGTTLLVSFEDINAVQSRVSKLSLGHEIATAKGWSSLTLLGDGDTWFRDKAVYSYFDQLVDDAFLEDFDQVLFLGSGNNSYAACAYSVTAPGAQVLAINPIATLNPGQAGWDNRFAKARQLDFTSRYGYAPDMVAGANKVYVVFDPTMAPDAMHAALFRASHIVKLPARHASNHITTVLEQTKQLQGVIEQAMNNTLTPTAFGRIWRTRRNNGLYLRGLLGKAEQSGKPERELRICKNVTTRLRAPRFAKRLAQLLAKTATAAPKPAQGEHIATSG